MSLHTWLHAKREKRVSRSKSLVDRDTSFWRRASPPFFHVSFLRASIDENRRKRDSVSFCRN
ncbi:unnamed protein product, partial [Heterotrigona itama]